MSFINVNGKLLKAEEPALLASNRSYRYGDGVFETMRVTNGNIQLGTYHFERLFSSLQLLQMELPKLVTADVLQANILQLCKKNDCIQLSRVRLSVFRGNGGLYDGDKTAQFLIECWPLNPTLTRMNENGLVIDIYPDAKKAIDKFASIKSASFLPYNMAAQYAKEKKLNDCIVLNCNGNVADTTIANIFIIKGETFFTPSLSEACINGVMRRFLIEKLQESGHTFNEVSIKPADLESADEIFLTNAIRGIQWVKQLGDVIYSNTKTLAVYKSFF